MHISPNTMFTPARRKPTHRSPTAPLPVRNVASPSAQGCAIGVLYVYRPRVRVAEQMRGVRPAQPPCRDDSNDQRGDESEEPKRELRNEHPGRQHPLISHRRNKPPPGRLHAPPAALAPHRRPRPLCAAPALPLPEPQSPLPSLRRHRTSTPAVAQSRRGGYNCPACVRASVSRGIVGSPSQHERSRGIDGSPWQHERRCHARLFSPHVPQARRFRGGAAATGTEQVAAVYELCMSCA